MTRDEQDHIYHVAKKQFPFYCAFFHAVFYLKVTAAIVLVTLHVIWQIPGKIWDYCVFGGKCNG